MRRSRLVFIAVSVLSVVLSAAAYADTMATTPASSDIANAVNMVLDQSKPQGWLAMHQSNETFSQVSSDAQALVGATVAQLTQEMGTPGPTASDGKGGTLYFYDVSLNYIIGGAPVADEWFDVSPDGKVLRATVSAN
jgi:hypothetical protein